jgi:ABC-type polysaccharide/polyol phosphate transport system ATPase subunit
MSFIKLENVSLSYPILRGNYVRSIKQSVVMALSGKHSFANGLEPVTVIDALKNINFELKSGDRLGLIGRNGAGKSTLLRVLAGIYPPTQGNLEASGTISPLLGISVGMNPMSTGYENIRFRCLLHGFDKKKIQNIIREVEDFTELGHFLSMPVKTYSSGMNVRLSFGIATAITPDILLIDEVVGVGDAQFIEKAQKRLNNLIESSNILVLASHSEDIIKKFCNKILWLEQGSVVHFCQDKIDEVLMSYHRSCIV